jgi:hypothetical protein
MYYTIIILINLKEICINVKRHIFKLTVYFIIKKLYIIIDIK